MKNYQFTEDWFSHNISAWEGLLAELKDKPIHILEIGCFEGRATCWLLENILTNPHSTITCIDTFKGSPEHEAVGIDMVAVRDRFFHNIRETGSDAKVYVLTGESQRSLTAISYNRYSMVYIDGSHATADVFIDAALSWKLCKQDGIIIFDDYLWKNSAEFDPAVECDYPKPAIDAFLRCFSDQIEILHMGMQVAVRKTARRTRPVYKI